MRAKLIVITALMLIYAGLGFMFEVCFGEEILYTHFGYLPIVLAGFWWGMRGWVVVAPLAALVLTFHATGIDGGGILPDLGRIASYIIVSSAVGLISDRLASGRRALEASEEKYRQVTEKSLSGIFVYRGETIVFANIRLLKMLDYGPEEMIGRSIWGIICPEDHPKVRELIERRIREGFSDLHYEARYVKKDGSVIWVETRSSITGIDDGPEVIVNIYDITARKEAEEKERKLSELARTQEEQLIHSTRLAELGEMAAGVAHELNQPLTGIRNFARNTIFMVEQGAGKPSEVVENLNMISRQVDRASRIISQMRELARKTERKLEPVDLCAVAAQTADFLAPEFSRRGIAVEKDLPPGLPSINGDRMRIEQVFLNIFNNAMHAMEKTDRKKLIVKARAASGGREVALEIRDTGIGFDSAVKARLFTPFFTTKEPGKGTGLGLSISLSIIKEHGGAIEASGEPGAGACFTVILPAAGQKKEEAR